MAFEKMGAFTFNHTRQPDELNSPADEVKKNFDSRGNELKTALNKIVDLLNSTVDGFSGADNVGATGKNGLTGTTVQALIDELKTLVDVKETPNGALEKANAAEVGAKNYAKSIVNAHIDNHIIPHEYIDTGTNPDFVGLVYALIIKDGTLYLEVLEND